MLSLISLQDYLCFEARQRHEVVSSPPFTLFFDTTDSSTESNYAIPDASGSSDLRGGLPRLQTIFTGHARKPCLQVHRRGVPISGDRSPHFWMVSARAITNHDLHT